MSRKATWLNVLFLPKQTNTNVHLPISGFWNQFFSSLLQELRESVQLLLTTKIAVYLMTFLIVTVAWAAHIRWPQLFPLAFVMAAEHWCITCSPLLRRLFQVIVRIDDCLALLNLVSISETASRAIVHAHEHAQIYDGVALINTAWLSVGTCEISRPCGSPDLRSSHWWSASSELLTVTWRVGESHLFLVVPCEWTLSWFPVRFFFWFCPRPAWCW